MTKEKWEQADSGSGNLYHNQQGTVFGCPTMSVCKDPSSKAMVTPKTSISAEEKRRQRQEKLAAWKKKKSQETKERQKVALRQDFRTREAKSSNKVFGKVKKVQKNKSFDNEGDDEEEKKLLQQKHVYEEDESDDDDPLERFMDDISNAADQPIGEKKPVDGDVDDDEMIDETVEIPENQTDDASEMLDKLKNKDKKEIPSFPPSEEPFRKSFYKGPELVDEQRVKLLRELEKIDVKGNSATPPALSWAELGLPSQILQLINSLEFEAPTGIQSEALPNIMSGKDMIGIAKTGSGKTLAFLLPMFRQIIDQRPLSKGEGPIAVILTPTRELCIQIFKECKPFLRALKLRGVCAYGGSSISQQIAELKRGAEVVVCTPGRMIDLLAANSGRVTNLSRVTYLVLDEADRMFDMGFEPQAMKIVSNTRPDRQTVLFSATFPPKMESLAKKILTLPVEIQVGDRSVVSDTIDQEVIVVSDSESKFNQLLSVLGAFRQQDVEGKVLIFVEKQDSADLILSKLLTRGYACMSLHGGKDQMDRDGIINDFKSSVVDMLVATSVAARGLDVKNLNLVVNFDVPTHVEDYVHRVGRTGRAGKRGRAVTFVMDDEEKGATDITKALKMSNQPVPAKLNEMAERFWEKVKKGNFKYSSGFGGKGLEKLEQKRESTRDLERRQRGPELDAEPTKEGENKEVNDSAPFDVEYGSQSAGPDGTEYFAKIQINDLPQTVRWTISNKESITKVVEGSHTSITSKGRYYPEGAKPSSKEDPKLYLLVEGNSEVSVKKAVSLFKNLMVEGIYAASQEDRRPGKYKIA